jgi:transposase InsO family protein
MVDGRFVSEVLTDLGDLGSLAHRNLLRKSTCRVANRHVTIAIAVVLDAFSRKVVGWALDDHLEARLAIQALDDAILARDPAPHSLIHHSDLGVQYACGSYTERLEGRQIAVSMSRAANPGARPRARRSRTRGTTPKPRVS